MPFHFYFSRMIFLIMLMMSLPIFSQGDRTGNGGDAIFCDGEEPIMLDYYQATLKTVNNKKINIINVNKMSPFKIHQYFENWIIKNTKFSIFTFKAIKIKLKSYEQWRDSELNPQSDSNLGYEIPKHCRIKRAANRQDEVIFGNSHVINLLNPSQRTILELHEYFYYLFQVKTSEAIRDIFSVMLTLNPDKPDKQRIIDKFNNLNFVYDLRFELKIIPNVKKFKRKQFLNADHHLKVKIIKDNKSGMDSHEGNLIIDQRDDQIYRNVLFNFLDPQEAQSVTINTKESSIDDYLLIANYSNAEFFIQGFVYGELIFDMTVKKKKKHKLRLNGLN